MSIEQMREALKRSYNYDSWHAKVDKMSDAQVAAVYKRLLLSKKL